MSNKIYVGGLAAETTEKGLFDHFSKIGGVVSIVITKGINPQKHAGYGYVIMNNEKDTKAAISKLNNSLLDKSHIKVVLAHFLDQERRERHYRSYFSKKGYL